jgi:hypothetical protein
MINESMKFGTDIAIDVKLLKRGPPKTILEIKFIGIHNHSWPHGKDIHNYLKTIVEKHEPDAIILDYLQYQYSFGNELGDTILTPIIDFKKKSFRPCAIIAEEPTMKSIHSLIVYGDIEKVCDIVLLSDKAEALEYLKKRT